LFAGLGGIVIAGEELTLVSTQMPTSFQTLWKR
jgi:hypothetical protein